MREKVIYEIKMEITGQKKSTLRVNKVKSLRIKGQNYQMKYQNYGIKSKLLN